ncbi:MAG: sodium:proton antiporter [bacterium]|nr:sodium:proton antiporter [bacterium]
MIYYLLAAALFGIGIFGALTKRNLIKIIISLTIAEYAIFLFLVLIGYREGAEAPILTPSQEPAAFVDPLPQAVVLTAIVIGLATTALLVAVAVRIYGRYKTLDTREIRRLKG